MPETAWISVLWLSAVSSFTVKSGSPFSSTRPVFFIHS